jgi:hypothetical protein
MSLVIVSFRQVLRLGTVIRGDIKGGRSHYPQVLPVRRPDKSHGHPLPREYNEERVGTWKRRVTQA